MAWCKIGIFSALAVIYYNLSQKHFWRCYILQLLVSLDLARSYRNMHRKWPLIPYLVLRFRDDFEYAPSQWEMTLQCKVISYWLGACTKRPLVIVYIHLPLLFPHAFGFSNGKCSCLYSISTAGGMFQSYIPTYTLWSAIIYVCAWHIIMRKVCLLNMLVLASGMIA